MGRDMRYNISKTPPIKPQWGHSWMSWKLWEMCFSFDIFDSTLCNTAELFIPQTLHNLFRSIICCLELKHCFWHRGPTVYSSSANPNYSIFRILKKKSGTLNIKDPISLFKDTRHLLLCSHKHAASEKQMKSSLQKQHAVQRNTSVRSHAVS